MKNKKLNRLFAGGILSVAAAVFLSAAVPAFGAGDTQSGSSTVVSISAESETGGNPGRYSASGAEYGSSPNGCGAEPFSGGIGKSNSGTGKPNRDPGSHSGTGKSHGDPGGNRDPGTDGSGTADGFHTGLESGQREILLLPG